MNDDLHRLLEEAGRREVPPVSGEFADDLEARLLAVATGLPDPAAGGAAPEPRRRTLRPRSLLAGAGAVALAIAVVAVLVGPPHQAPESTSIPVAALDRPVHVEVVLPGGEILEDPDGLLLPAGAIVRVGAGGSARIGDTILAPGDVATVGEDRVLVERASPQAIVDDPTSVRTPRPTTTAGRTAVPSRPPASVAPSTAPMATPGPASGASPTPAPTPEDRTLAPATAPPATAPPARPDPTSTPAATATPTPSPPILRPRLRARLIDGPRIAVTWTETFRARSYVLIASLSRRGPASDPVYPGSRVLGEFATPPERRLRYRVPAGVVEVKLQVLALRGNGSVLRRSRIVTIVIPQGAVSPSGDLTGTSPTLDPAASASPGPDPSAGP